LRRGKKKMVLNYSQKSHPNQGQRRQKHSKNGGTKKGKRKPEKRETGLEGRAGSKHPFQVVAKQEKRKTSQKRPGARGTVGPRCRE